jgi:hypothetical protein
VPSLQVNARSLCFSFYTNERAVLLTLREKRCMLSRKCELEWVKHSTTPIGLHGEDFVIKHTLNQALKFFEKLEHFRSMPKEINPSELTKIIYETNIVFFMVK